MAETDVETDVDREHELWRQRQLVRSGFPSVLAARIALDRGYDVHALIELVERGCPPGLAARILAPLDERTEAR
jgi:hypothetical protein